MKPWSQFDSSNLPTALMLALTLVAANPVLAADPPGKPGGAPGGPPRPMSVDTAPVTMAAVHDELSAVGTLQANESVMMRPEVSGRITTLHFKEGQAVRSGELLFTLDATELQAQVTQSTATVKLNEINFKRAAELLTQNLVSQREHDELSAKLEESRAKLALDQSRLDKSYIRAPFSGVLGVRNVSPGAYVKPGDDLVSLEDIATLKVEFRIPEANARDVRVGQRIEVRMDAYPGEVFAGEIYTLDTRVDSTSRTLLLRGRIANHKRALRPGMFARVAVVLATRANALVVPEQAIVPQGKDQFVYRVVDGKAVQTKIDIGRRLAGRVEVIAGLSPQDVVIIAGQMKVRDGMPVNVGGDKPAASGGK